MLSFETLGLVAAAASDAMIMVDGSGTIVEANARAERLFGYEAGHLKGKPVELLVPQRNAATHRARRDGYLGAPHPRPMGDERAPLFGRRKDGSEFAAEISLTPIRSGDALIVIATVVDVSVSHRAEEDRQRRLYEQARLRQYDGHLPVAVQELWSPLLLTERHLRAISEGLARASITDLEQLRADVQGAEENLGRAFKLLDQLLIFSRATGDAVKLEPEEMDLVAVVQGVAQLVEEKLRKAGCELVLQLPAQPIRGRWDHLRIEQIVASLLSRAIELGAGHPIEVLVSPEPRCARLSVRDFGPGIPIESQEALFAAGGRLGSVRKIAEAHGGSVHLWSRVGVGTTLIVMLPMVAPPVERDFAQ